MSTKPKTNNYVRESEKEINTLALICRIKKTQNE